MKGSKMRKQFNSIQRVPDLGDYIKTFSRRYLSSKEAALYLGLSLPYFRLLARRNNFPYSQFSKQSFFFKKSDLDRYRNEQLLAKRTKYFNRYFNNKSKKG